MFSVLSISLPLGVVFPKIMTFGKKLREVLKTFSRHFAFNISKNILIQSENWEHALRNKIKVYIVFLESLDSGVTGLGSSCVWGDG